MPIYHILQSLNVQNWDLSYEDWQKTLGGSMFRYVVGLLVALGVVAYWFVLLGFRSAGDKKVKVKKTDALRRFVANAISLLSPRIGQWVMVAGTRRSGPTAFYYQMTGLLEPVGLIRRPTQTHREFANEVDRYFAEHPSSTQIGTIVRQVTELFNDVRFGKHELPAELRSQVNDSINELKQDLALNSAVLEDRSTVVLNND